MQVIGHRGAAALAPENTLAAIDAALAGGADGVEIDVRLSADGVPVLAHDADLERMWGTPARVGEMSAADLRALGLATLGEAMERVPPGRTLIIEIKGSPWEPGHDPAEPVARAVAAAVGRAPREGVVVSSFNPSALEVVRTEAPEIRTAVLTGRGFDLSSNLAAAVAGGHRECHVPTELLDRSFVGRAHDAGRSVVAWTVNAPDVLRSFASWGVDGSICDDPVAAREALG